MKEKEIYWCSLDDISNGISKISEIHDTQIVPVFLVSDSVEWNLELNRLGIPSYSGNYSPQLFLEYSNRFSKMILISEEFYQKKIAELEPSIRWKASFDALQELEQTFCFLKQLQPLRETVIRLRAPNGCPYDQQQTHSSLKRNLIEETYEVLEAIEKGDFKLLKEELGDLLLQIVFHAQLAEEQEIFSLDDVVEEIVAKLIRRHPHVFENQISAIEIGTVLANWEEIKLKEKGKTNRGIIDGIPNGLPALLKSQKILEKVEKVGFKWESLEFAINKLKEEELEFFNAENLQDKVDELGDIFLAWVGVARFFDINPEIALERTNQRFIERFKYLESLVKQEKLEWNNCSTQELLALWNQSKKNKK